jgi:hypothetical protein
LFTGTLEHEDTGTMGHWNPEITGTRDWNPVNTGTLVHWNPEITGTLVRWITGT